MIRPFEVVYIFDSTLEEAAVNERLEKFHALVAIEGAEAPRFNHWGKRTLAYPIRKKDTGYYVIANFQADTAALPEFERALKLDEGVLRFLLVADDKDYTPTRAPGERRDGDEEE
jgi:small subunit ribosomal protein S6